MSKIRCVKCQEILESLHRHDFRSCGCHATAIDGGNDYLRVLWEEGFYPETIETPDESRARLSQ